MSLRIYNRTRVHRAHASRSSRAERAAALTILICRLTAFTYLVCSLVVGSGFAGAGAAFAQTSHGGAVTRFVKLFSDQESALLEALRAGHAAEVRAFLTETFEERTAATPDEPLPRADWIRDRLADPPASFAIERMAVHEYGDTVVVSFLQTITPRSGADRRNTSFVVDVWIQKDNVWRLASRYSSGAAAGPPGNKKRADQ